MIQLKNNAQSMLAYPVNGADTTLTVIPEDIGRFPALTVPGDHFYCALADSQGNLEFVKVTGTDAKTATLTVVRGAEGTTARGWNTGDRVQLRMSMATWADMAGDWWQRVKTAAGDALAPTLVSASSFSLSGDWTGEMQEGRRLRITASDGTLFKGHVASATLADGTTTVTVGGEPAPQLAGTLVAVDMGFSTEMESHLTKIRADSALSSKTAAAASASTAATKAGEAATSASSALASKNAAATSASTATTKAGEASDSATAAKDSETSALASAETAANSATVAQAAKAAAEAARDEAQDIANVGPATTVKLGLVKMDGKTTQADAGGVITVKDVAIGGDLADLASARGQIGDAKEMPNLDFNTLTTPGNYRITGNPTNGPSLPLNISGASIGSLIVAGTLGQNGRIFQIMISGSTVTWRTVQNSTGTTWSAWQQLLSGNKVGDGIRVTNGIISVPEMQGATASTSGTSGLVPPAAAGQHESFLTGGGEYKHITSLGPVSEKSQDLGTISGAVTIDLSAGLSVIATVGGATTLAFANVPAGGTVTVLLRLTNGGAYAVTWGMAPRWGNGIAPVLSQSGADYIAFYHAEGEWTGLLVTSNVQ